MATPKIQATRNYRMFRRSSENRVVTVKEHKRLFNSMKKYGYLACFPIACHRNGSKELVVDDGQHRLTFAEQLGLQVYYTIHDSEFDIAEINSAAKVWVVRDYASKHAANGKQDYQEVIDFSEQHGVPIAMAAGMLSGTTSFGNIRGAFFGGTYKVKDRAWASLVASIYVPITTLSGSVKNVRFLQACMGVCRVKDFEAKRLLQNTQRCRERLISYSTKDAYLDMLEEIYNFGRKQLFGLKAAATMAMRDRSPLDRKRCSK